MEDSLAPADTVAAATAAAADASGSKGPTLPELGNYQSKC